MKAHPIAVQLDQIRQMRGMSIRGLEKASGVSKATLSQMFRGQHIPFADTLDRVAASLGMSVVLVHNPPAE